MRIVSLLPSATEIVCGLGLQDELVGISHRCDYPGEIEGKTVVTRPPTRRVARTEFVDTELGPAELDAEALVATRPELILLRDGSPGGISAGQLRDVLGPAGLDPTIVSLDTLSIEGFFNSISTIGAMAIAEDDAIELVEALREELGDLEQQVVQRRDEGVKSPRVVVLTNLEQPFGSGRWLPEQVRRAGGWDLLGREGESAAAVEWEAIRDLDPDMLFFAPAGMHLPEAKRAFARLRRPEVWDEIGAVRRGRIFILEPVYFERPGPRLLDGIAMLAEIMDPDAFEEIAPPGAWTPILE